MLLVKGSAAVKELPQNLVRVQAFHLTTAIHFHLDIHAGASRSSLRWLLRMARSQLQGDKVTKAFNKNLENITKERKKNTNNN